MRRECGTLKIEREGKGVRVCLVGEGGMRVVCESGRGVVVEYGEGEAGEEFRLERLEVWGR